MIFAGVFHRKPPKQPEPKVQDAVNSVREALREGDEATKRLLAAIKAREGHSP